MVARLSGYWFQPVLVRQRVIWLGGSTPYLALNAAIAVSSPRISVTTWAVRAVPKTREIAGRINAARIPMITITTISSTSVNPARGARRVGREGETRMEGILRSGRVPGPGHRGRGLTTAC